MAHDMGEGSGVPNEGIGEGGGGGGGNLENNLIIQSSPQKTLTRNVCPSFHCLP